MLKRSDCREIVLKQKSSGRLERFLLEVIGKAITHSVCFTNLRDKVRYGVMIKALQAKFTQHKDLKDILLSTGAKTLIEDAKNDKVWGVGRDGKGQNLLGKALMQVRDELKED